MTGSQDLPRYSRQAFPAYTYVPGESPHPTRDPEGHSYGHIHEEAINFDIEHWQDCDDYLYGIDCFNHGYFWEAHEALEAVWIAAGRTSQTGFFIQGLIQIAVAMLKRKQDFIDVSQRMAHDGLEKIHPGLKHHLGIDVLLLRQQTEAFIQDPSIARITLKLDLE